MKPKTEKSTKQTKRISIFIALGLLICAVLTLSALASEPTGVKGDTCYTHGDMNADGTVNTKDAIYLLYHATMEEGYPVEQDCDFEQDGTLDKKDAIYLLYRANKLFAETLGYKLKGTIHAYGEPIWTWDLEDEVSATASYTCACGEKHVAVVVAVTSTSASTISCFSPQAQV